MKMIDEVLELLFPSRCGFCGKLDVNALCEECLKSISLKNIYGINDLEDKFFEDHISVMPYNERCRQKILEYKFNGKSYLYKTFAKIILNNEKICKILLTYDIMTIVPLHKKRKAERGYNQSELIASEIAKNLNGLEYINLLKKIKNNPKQSLLTKEKRIANVKNAYEVINQEILVNKKIILFDDIYTTGSTVNECARILKENGAKEVLVLTLAKAKDIN